MTYNSFYYGLSLLDTLYGIDLEEDDYAEIALTGWKLIGNKRMRTYRYSTCSSDEGVELPCNCDLIEAVTSNIEDFQRNVNAINPSPGYAANTEQYIEHTKTFKHPLYASGKFIKYEQVGDKLYFDRPHGVINILYRGELLDDDGLPLITDTEATALATYVAYIVKFKEGILTSNANTVQLAEQLRLLWLIKCDQAREDQYITQNEWDQILDAKNTWNRKVYNKSLKVYR